jgi:NADH-quinone oxidoreductase subunit J
MSSLEIIFIIVALATLFSALRVVTTPNIVHAALWLVGALFGVAVIFALLNASFLAVVQVVIYIGAIAILMIFAIMLTRRSMDDSGPQVNANWWLAALLGLILFAGLATIVLKSGTTDIGLPVFTDNGAFLAQLGEQLVSPNAYVLPFELASVLLLAVLIGAIVVARKK